MPIISISSSFFDHDTSSQGAIGAQGSVTDPAARPEFFQRDAQIVLGHGPMPRRFSTLTESKRPSTSLRCFLELRVSLCRFDNHGLLYKEPCEGVSRIGPVRLQEDVGEEAVGFDGLVAEPGWSWIKNFWTCCKRSRGFRPVSELALENESTPRQIREIEEQRRASYRLTITDRLGRSETFRHRSGRP
jgi:hypothetical protein